MVVTQK